MSNRLSKGQRRHLLAILFEVAHPKMCAAPTWIPASVLAAAKPLTREDLIRYMDDLARRQARSLVEWGP